MLRTRGAVLTATVLAGLLTIALAPLVPATAHADAGGHRGILHVESSYGRMRVDASRDVTITVGRFDGTRYRLQAPSLQPARWGVARSLSAARASSRLARALGPHCVRTSLVVVRPTNLIRARADICAMDPLPNGRIRLFGKLLSRWSQPRWTPPADTRGIALSFTYGSWQGTGALEHTALLASGVSAETLVAGDGASTDTALLVGAALCSDVPLTPKAPRNDVACQPTGSGTQVLGQVTTTFGVGEGRVTADITSTTPGAASRFPGLIAWW